MKSTVMRAQAFSDFELQTQLLRVAVEQDDYQKQLIALAQMIDALQEAKAATVGLAGGFLN